MVINKKKFILFFVLLLIENAFAHEDEIKEGENLVLSRVSCTNLNEEQFENIGEYYMELMHPGEFHEIMDERMGGEGSESLRSVHINMATMMYCGNANAMPMNMMNTMMNRGSSFRGMMGYGSGYGMISYWPYGGWTMLFWIIVILIIMYLLVKYFNEGTLNMGSNSLEILKRRYARGEITKKQFEEIKKDLK
jgi:putative membrane protein